MYMHIGGPAPIEAMAQKVKAVLDRMKAARGHNPADAKVPAVTYTVDTPVLNTILGHRGERSKGV